MHSNKTNKTNISTKRVGAKGDINSKIIDNQIKIAMHTEEQIAYIHYKENNICTNTKLQKPSA